MIAKEDGKNGFAGLIAGLLFAVGLGVSEMTQPARVIGFLDFFGDWDPTLVFVMGGAVVTYAIAVRLAGGTRRRPLFAERFYLPTRRDIDARLVGGAALFGVGWGLAGFCPGPALVATATGAGGAWTFIVAMVGGMFAWSAVERLRARGVSPYTLVSGRRAAELGSDAPR